MKKKYIDNAKLGLFVMAGVLFLVLSLYMIGRNRNLFGATFTLQARFNNVNGLVPGNNVRFSGIDVGTVQKIEIAGDTAIQVTMIIDRKVREHIKENAIATIGTDGLMGNKLININPGLSPSQPIAEGGVLKSRKPVETDEMLRTLNTTNDNIAIISHNLREITGKLNNSNSLWNLLADTLITYDIKRTAQDLRLAGHNAASFTGRIDSLILEFQQGDGLAGALFTDTVMHSRLSQSLMEIQRASEHTATLTNDLKEMVKKIEQGKGMAGALLSDSTWTEKLHQTIINVEEGTSRFNENMEALKHNFLFRGYFRKQQKAMGKEQKADNR